MLNLLRKAKRKKTIIDKINAIGLAIYVVYIGLVTVYTIANTIKEFEEN